MRTPREIAKEIESNTSLDLVHDRFIVAEKGELTDVIEAALIQARASAPSDWENRLRLARENIALRAHAFGFKPDELQGSWRSKPERPWIHGEVDAAVLDALITQGHIPAWSGDGVECVVQMIEAQWRRAETYKAQVAEARASGGREMRERAAQCILTRDWWVEAGDEIAAAIAALPDSEDTAEGRTP